MFSFRKKSPVRHESGPPTGPRQRPALFQTGPTISQSGGVGMPGGFGKAGSVIRLPVGAMVVSVVIFVALLVLAYEVGFTRGQSRSVSQTRQTEETGQPGIWTQGDPVPIEPGSSTSGASGKPDKLNLPSPIRSTNTSAVARVPRPETTTPRPDADASGRVPGLNYCILASYGKDDAQRLSLFMKTKGVDNVVVLTHNKKLFQVVGLRGFTALEYQSPLFEEHRKKLRQFGREWKEKQHGPDDLKDIWVEKYTAGPTTRPD